MPKASCVEIGEERWSSKHVLIMKIIDTQVYDPPLSRERYRSSLSAVIRKDISMSVILSYIFRHFVSSLSR